MSASSTATVIDFKAPGVTKLENGYFRIANGLAESIARFPFTSRQLRVLIAVARMTYGYQKRIAALPTSKIAEICNLPACHTRKTVAELIAAKVLFREGGQKGAIGINNHTDQWRFATKTVANKDDGFATKTVANSATKTVANSATKTVANHPRTPYIEKESFKEEAERKAAGGGTMDFSAFPYEQISILWDEHLKPLGYGFKMWTPPRMQRVDTLYQFMVSQPPSLRKVSTPDDFVAIWETAVDYWGNGGLKWLLNDSKARFSFDWILDPENGYDRFIQAISGNYAGGRDHG